MLNFNESSTILYSALLTGTIALLIGTKLQEYTNLALEQASINKDDYNGEIVANQNLQNCKYGTRFFENAKILKDEGLSYDFCGDLKELRSRNMDLLTNKEVNLLNPIIPHISHHIWLSNKNSPREMTTKYYHPLETSIKTMDDSQGNWSHIFWTNVNIDTIPVSKLFADSHGMKIRSISELNIDPLMEEHVDNLIQTSEFAKASDIVRYYAVQKIGGVYMDLDYHLIGSLDKLTSVYSSFFGVEGNDEQTLGNSFIAATPSHHILNILVDLLTRNMFHRDEAPYYVQYPYSKFEQTLFDTGPRPLTVAYYKGAHYGNNTDIALSHGIIYSHQESPGAGTIYEIPRIDPNYEFSLCYNDVTSIIDFAELGQLGNDPYECSWCSQPGLMDAILYC